ncbi:essential MCU regulator, mitochondrial [Bradysia coprophila]|uniref:essential MCU regulator, mitochondrial n=1 Tax=Bradysia coprophila TaxID=38358 RepID=UPI00187D7ADA|nr:essential MCU regulator, mitochondrial [Bradysia coprophila]
MINLIRVNASNIIRNAITHPTSTTVRYGGTFYRTGAIKPMPKVLPFGFLGLIGSVVPGLFIGAAISKSVANFLEENELFVPSDDDDDED